MSGCVWLLFPIIIDALLFSRRNQHQQGLVLTSVNGKRVKDAGEFPLPPLYPQAPHLLGYALYARSTDNLRPTCVLCELLTASGKKLAATARSPVCLGFDERSFDSS